MKTSSDLIETHAQDLAEQKAGADKLWKRHLAAAILLAFVSVIGPTIGAGVQFGSLALLASIVMLFLFMRKSDEARDLDAERLEFERPELHGLKPTTAEGTEAAEPARLKFLTREIISRKRMRLVRNRARYAEASGTFLGLLAFLILVYFGLSLEDFLSQYHSASPKEQEELYDYELEVLSIGIFALVFAGWSISRFRSARSARAELDRLELEHEIMPVEDKPDVARARKLLLVNQRGLTQYYTVNRFNSRVSIAIAVLCVFAGVAITIWTISRIVDSGTTTENANLVVAGVGAANAIMINVVAAIVLRIQATISSNVNAFHDRLVRSNDILLANVIAAEIDDDAVRRDTLAAISKAIGLRGAPKAADKSSDAEKKDTKT